MVLRNGCVRGGFARNGYVLSSRGMGGPITPFNIYISHVNKIQKEERGASPRFLFWFLFMCSKVMGKMKKGA